MSKHRHNTLIHLSDNALLKLHDAKGTLVQCHRGTLWITQANDTKDVIVHVCQKCGSKDAFCCSLKKPMDDK